MNGLDLKDKVTEWLGLAKNELIKNYHGFGLKASGKWENDLESYIEENKNGIKFGIKGAYYTYWMENGRGPTSEGKRGRLYGIILNWVKQKGISTSKLSQKSFAWVVAQKIDREGIKVPNRFNPGGLVETSISNTLIEKLKTEISVVYQQRLKSDVILILKGK